MPSKRSRAWHQRKLAAEAALRLAGTSGTNVMVGTNAKITFGGQVLESFKDFSFTETGRVLEEPRHIDDRADAFAYAFKQQREVEEAAQRLAGTFVDPAQKKSDEWLANWGAGSPFPKQPRLDGRRWKK